MMPRATTDMSSRSRACLAALAGSIVLLPAIAAAAPAAPTLATTSPGSPSNSENPSVIGGAEDGSTVRGYSSGDCASTPLATSSAAELASPGISVRGPEQHQHDHHLVGDRHRRGLEPSNTSPCSPVGLRYTEDSIAPKVMITFGPAAKIVRLSQTFMFRVRGAEPRARFQCKLDRGRFKALQAGQAAALTLRFRPEATAGHLGMPPRHGSRYTRHDGAREGMARHVLVITRDRVGPQMAGPAIRAVELARALAAENRVRLAAPFGESVDPEIPFFIYDRRDPASLRGALEGVDVVFSDPLSPAAARAIPGGGRRWIVDLYNPEPFEGLESHRNSGSSLARAALDTLRLDRLLFAARAGSAFVCANDRQRDMWLGFLAAARRVGSGRYDADPEGRDLVEIVRFGIPSEPPLGGSPLLRGPLFPEDSKILLWSGGLWDWLDPLTVLEALALLRRTDPRWVCAFIGTVRPHGGQHFTMVQRSRDLAERLGLSAAGAVGFIDWLPYKERGTPLLEADAAVCAHFKTMETRFAVRTRLFDAVWAGLPILTVEGDEWEELTTDRRLGEVAPAEDPVAMAAAARSLAENGRPYYAPGLEALAGELRWPLVARPLTALVERAEDLPPARSASLATWLMAARHSSAQRAYGGAARLPGWMKSRSRGFLGHL